MAPKEAVVIILDASSTMASTFLEEPKSPPNKVEDQSSNISQDGGSSSSLTLSPPPQSLFDASKAAAQMIMIDLMTRSMTHEACVIVLKTRETSHHLMEEAEEETELLFPNITELPLLGLSRPTTSLLRRVAEVKPTNGKSIKKEEDANDDENDDDESPMQGDFCDGLIIAADTIKRRTKKNKYNRRIILITDAKHRVMVDEEQLSVLLDSMVEMDCKLQVVGWNFKPSPPVGGDDIKMKVENEDEIITDHAANNDDDDEEGEDQIKSQNESLLLQLASKTNGSVVAVSNMRELMDAVLDDHQRKKVQSVKYQTEYHVAPGMVLCSTRYSLLMKKATPPSLIKEAVMLEDDTKLPMKNALGVEMTHAVTFDYKHLDPDDLELVLEQYDRTPAYRFGNDYIPIGKVDLAGLATLSPCCIRVLGYIDADVAPRHLVVGPPYLITGVDSIHDCAAISALSQSLQRLKYVAICTFVKQQNKDPTLAGLFPFTETCQATSRTIHRLVLFQLPFAGDVQRFTLPSLDEYVTEEASSGCDELISALMLQDEDLACDRIPNPYLTLYNRMVGERAANPTSKLVPSARGGYDDRMSAPPHILDKAALVIKTFYEKFPLVAVETAPKSGARGATTKRKGPLSSRDLM